MDVHDLKSKFVDKYDNEIKELIEWYKNLGK